MVSLPRNTWSGLPERPCQLAAEHISMFPRNVWSISAVYPMNGTHTIEKCGDLKLQIFADHHKIDQVMINLLNNAVKYAPGSKIISIGIEHDSHFVKITVTDKGIGIAESNIETIFERFSKVDNGQQSQAGFGMGLYICSEIIKRHGGEIGVDSILGQGSSFWFTIPDAA